MLTKEERYIIKCDTCGKEEIFYDYDASGPNGHYYFNQSKFLDWEGKKFCSKDCASKSQINDRQKEINALISPFQKKEEEKKQEEKEKKEWEKRMSEKVDIIPRWVKAGLNGPNEYQLRIMSGSHIGRGLISYGMVGRPNNVMKIVDYDEHPPLIPEEWYSENPERAEWLETARKKDLELSTKGGKKLES